MNVKDLLLSESAKQDWDDVILFNKITWSGNLAFQKKEGKPFWVQVNIELISDTTDTPIGYQMICFDLTEKLVLQELSIRDPLTKIYNGNKILEFINYEIEYAHRYEIPFSIILLDIDDFKITNDTFGHNFGDIVLIEFTKILTKNVRNIDLVGRWGGEEFILILPQTNIKNSILIAERIKKNISKSIISFNGISVSLNTTSFGITEYKKNDILIELLERVDQALYKAKNNGKNSISTF